jgi:hypothetical protein
MRDLSLDGIEYCLLLVGNLGKAEPFARDSIALDA